MEIGQEAYARGDYAQAAEAFLSAYEARPFSAFLYNAGIANERMDEAQQAIELYERYIAAEPNASDIEEVNARIVRLRRILGIAPEPPESPEAPEGTAPEGTASESDEPEQTSPPEETEASPEAPLPAQAMKSLLSVETNPGDAQITLRQNGEIVAQGPSPFAHSLDEGDYDVSVEHPDYRTITRTMRIRPGKVYVAILELSQGEFLGYLRVRSNPPGAAVYVDEREQGSMGQTPFANPLPVGTHRIWIERPGYEVVEREVEVSIGDEVIEEVSLERVTYGRLRVTANVPGAEVFVDGERVGSVPYDGQFEAGEHEVTVSAPDMKDWEEDITLQRGQLTPLRIRLRPAVSRAGAWTTALIGAAFIGGGVTLGLLSNNLRRDIEDDIANHRLSSEDSRLREAQFMAGGADLSFAVGGILGLLSIYYFLRDPLPDSEATVLEPRDWTFVPHLNPTSRAGAGATFRLSF